MGDDIPVKRVLGTQQQSIELGERTLRQYVDSLRCGHAQHELVDKRPWSDQDRMPARPERFDQLARHDIHECCPFEQRLDLAVGSAQNEQPVRLGGLHRRR